MGLGRSEMPTDVGGADVDEGFLVRKSSRACVPPAMDRIWRGFWVDNAIWMMRFVESGGHLRDRRCSLVGRLVATMGSKSWGKTVLSRLVIN